MSESTLTSSATSSTDDEYLQYRELSMGAVASLVLGIISFIAMAFPALAVIPFLGAVIGYRAAKEIRTRPTELTGLTFARVGLWLCGFLFVSSLVWKAYDYATEVPANYTRVTWNELQPDKDYRPRIPVSPRSLDLHDTKVFIKGYVYPDDTDSELTSFVLVPDRGTCCFGGQPPLTHMIEVRLKEPLKIEYSIMQRKLGGILKVDTRQKPISGLGGVYYQLEADYLK